MPSSRVVVEYFHNRRTGDVENRPDELRKEHRAENSEARAALRPFVLPGAEVLTDEGRERHGEGGYGKKYEAFDLGVGAAARHGVRAEGVDVALNDNVCDGNYGVLDSGGNTLVHNFL